MLAINPGATTTELGYFNNIIEVWREEIDHYGDQLSDSIVDQLPFRFDKISTYLDNNIELDAIAARGGPLKPMQGGIYTINNQMLSDYRSAKYANHASNLGALLSAELQKNYKVPAYIVDPVTVDDFIDIARISGVPGIERRSRSHALNIKYCVNKAVNELKIRIENSKFIVAHLGSGFSIAAVKNGKIIDVNDALLGMGPFSIERAGSLPISGILDLVYSHGMERTDIEKMFSKGSGLKGYLNENQFTVIENKIEQGDQFAELIVNAMVYQIVKEISGIYGTFGADISALILTGGLSNSKLLLDKLNEYISFIEPQIIYPGSFELEALAEGVLRVLNGDEKAKEYL